MSDKNISAFISDYFSCWQNIKLQHILHRKILLILENDYRNTNKNYVTICAKTLCKNMAIKFVEIIHTIL